MIVEILNVAVETVASKNHEKNPLVFFLIHNQFLSMLNRMSCDVSQQAFHHWRHLLKKAKA